MIVNSKSTQLGKLFFHERDGVHDTLRSNVITLTLCQHTRRTQIKDKFASMIVKDGVAGVLAAVYTGNTGAPWVMRYRVNRLTFALVTEKGTGNHDNFMIFN